MRYFFCIPFFHIYFSLTQCAFSGGISATLAQQSRHLFGLLIATPSLGPEPLLVCDDCLDAWRKLLGRSIGVLVLVAFCWKWTNFYSSFELPFHMLSLGASRSSHTPLGWRWRRPMSWLMFYCCGFQQHVSGFYVCIIILVLPHISLSELRKYVRVLDRKHDVTRGFP